MVMGEMGKDISIRIIGESSTQMGVASGGGGGGGTSSKPGDSKKDDKKKDEKQKAGSLKKLIGIDISLAAMLKQSQIFTGFLGSVFQLIGMLVDVILAPLAPYLFKLVEIMASWIPVVGKKSEEIVQWLKNLVFKTADLFTTLSGVSVSASDLVKKGFQLVSIQGMSAIIGEQFAIKFGTIKGWTFQDLFKGSKDPDKDSIIKALKNAFSRSGKSGSKVMGAITGVFKAIFSALTSGWGTKLMTILKTLGKSAKILGTIGMIIGISFEIADIIAAFKEGNVGKAVMKIAILVLSLGIPIAIGLAFGAIPALIVGVIVGALALMWEFAVPPEIKDKIYKGIEDFFQEIKDVFSELFNLGGGSIFSKIIYGILLIFNLPFTMARVWLSLILSEGMKRSINEGVRSLADGLVNSLIRFINGLIEGVTSKIPDWVPKTEGIRNFQISEVDFSNLNLMMGTDSGTVGGVSASEHARRDMQLTGFGNTIGG